MISNTNARSYTLKYLSLHNASKVLMICFFFLKDILDIILIVGFTFDGVVKFLLVNL